MRIIQTTILTALLTTSAVDADQHAPPTDEVGIAVELVGTGLLDGLVESIDVNRTIRLVAVLPTGWRLDAVAGNSEQDLLLRCNNGTFYQSAFGGPTSKHINSAFFEFFPDIEFDSYVTIGSLTANGAPFDENRMGDIGVIWTAFEDQGGAISADNGTWYVTPVEEQGEQFAFTDTCGKARTGVTIAQLTLLGDGATVSFSGLLQGQDDVGAAWQAFFTLFETLDGDRSPVDIDHGCPSDLDGDGVVNVNDLLSMLTNWTGDHCVVDLTFDEVVDASDIIAMITQWGPCPTE